MKFLVLFVLIFALAAQAQLLEYESYANVLQTGKAKFPTKCSKAQDIVNLKYIVVHAPHPDLKQVAKLVLAESLNLCKQLKACHSKHFSKKGRKNCSFKVLAKYMDFSNKLGKKFPKAYAYLNHLLQTHKVGTK